METPYERAAYKKQLFRPMCNVESCGKWASYEVLGAHGMSFGQYCTEHADNRLRILGVDPETSEDSK